MFVETGQLFVTSLRRGPMSRNLKHARHTRSETFFPVASGSNVAPERTYSIQVPDNQTIQIGVQVFANGQVQFGGDFPADTLPCEGGGY